MTIRGLLIIALVLALTVAPAFAQTPLTLGDALARAVETSQRLAEARARQEGAEAATRLRKAADKPTLAVSGGYARTNHVDEFGVPQPDGALRIIYPDIPDNYFTRATLQWPIYTGGRSDALERAAAAEARATAADLAVARADLRLEVERAYWALATAGDSVGVVEEAVTRADAHVRDVRVRFDTGLVPPSDVASAEAQRARQELQLIEARNLRSSLVEDLRRLTGLDGDLVPAERLETTGAVVTVPAGVPECPELQALTERITAADERHDAAAAGRRPTISFTGTADYANPNPRIFPRADRWRTSWELGVVASWTVFDGGRVAAESAEAAAAAKAGRARQADLATVIATEARQRQLDLDSARSAVAAAAEGVRSATEARRVVTERFTVGVATSTEVLEAHVALLQAELDRTRALANIRLAEARLRRALGR